MSEKKRMAGLGSAIGTGIGWGLLAVVAAVGIGAIAVPAATGSVPLTVLTQSMEPTLPPGTLVVVKPTAPQDIHLGDVLTYQITPGKPELVTHRVTEVRSTSDGTYEFLTKGDNNDAADPEPVTVPQIKGTVWYSMPLIGYLNTAVGSAGSFWLVPLIGGAFLVYAGWLLVRGLAEAAAKRKKRAALADAEAVRAAAALAVPAEPKPRTEQIPVLRP